MGGRTHASKKHDLGETGWLKGLRRPGRKRVNQDGNQSSGVMENSVPIRISAATGRSFVSDLGDFTRRAAKHGTASFRHNRARREGLLALGTVTGDLMMIALGFVIAFWFRYHSGLVAFRTFTPPAGTVNEVVITHYWKLIFLGTAFVFGGLISKGAYEHRDLLSVRKFIPRFAGILTFGLFVFIGLTLAVQTNPPISRAFVLCSWFFIFLTVLTWRVLVGQFLQIPAVAWRLRKRLVVVGTGPETHRIQQELRNNLETEFVGWVQGSRPNRIKELESARLGSLHELEEILKKNCVDVAVLTETESLQREGIAFVVKVCEREHVQFKLVPHFLEILISGLSPSVMGGVPVLGVDSLPLNAYQNRILKRTLDIIGATIGLILSSPIFLFFGALVYLESPGPIVYRQTRSGRNGRLFQIYKIRSMRMDAEASGKPGWTSAADPRRLKIGALMRKWNIDEIPQFLNVLKGDMSLVGPRPERPELISHFKHIIPHYQIRHQCRAGMTGWAQVNGWRGDTDLEERIRCDIWYVEHWNLFLDFRIMVLTFFRSKNAC